MNKMFRVQGFEFRVHLADGETGSEFWVSRFELPTTDCQLQTADCKLQTADCRCQLPTADCSRRRRDRFFS